MNKKNQDIRTCTLGTLAMGQCAQNCRRNEQPQPTNQRRKTQRTQNTQQRCALISFDIWINSFCEANDDAVVVAWGALTACCCRTCAAASWNIIDRCCLSNSNNEWRTRPAAEQKYNSGSNGNIHRRPQYTQCTAVYSNRWLAYKPDQARIGQTISHTAAAVAFVTTAWLKRKLVLAQCCYYCYSSRAHRHTNICNIIIRQLNAARRLLHFIFDATFRDELQTNWNKRWFTVGNMGRWGGWGWSKTNKNKHKKKHWRIELRISRVFIEQFRFVLLYLLPFAIYALAAGRRDSCSQIERIEMLPQRAKIYGWHMAKVLEAPKLRRSVDCIATKDYSITTPHSASVAICRPDVVHTYNTLYSWCTVAIADDHREISHLSIRARLSWQSVDHCRFNWLRRVPCLLPLRLTHTRAQHESTLSCMHYEKSVREVYFLASICLCHVCGAAMAMTMTTTVAVRACGV